MQLYILLKALLLLLLMSTAQCRVHLESFKTFYSLSLSLKFPYYYIILEIKISIRTSHVCESDAREKKIIRARLVLLQQHLPDGVRSS